MEDDENINFNPKKNIRIQEDDYDTNLEQMLLDMYESNNWCNCLSLKSMIDAENHDLLRAQDIGIEVIINLFIRNVYDLNYFKDDMTNLQLGNLSAHKLYLHLKKTITRL